MSRVFRNGLHRVGSSEIQKAIANADRAVSRMILASGEPCIDCGMTTGQFDCGHFQKRECMATRFHPWNLARQNQRCNRFEGGRTYEFGLAIDTVHGKGTALFLYRLAHPLHERSAIPRDESWTVKELGTLADAARKGPTVYEQTYFMMRPWHRP